MLALIDAFHKELSDIRELSDSTVENYTYTVVDYYDYAKNTIKIDPVFSKGKHILRWLAHECRRLGRPERNSFDSGERYSDGSRPLQLSGGNCQSPGLQHLRC